VYTKAYINLPLRKTRMKKLILGVLVCLALVACETKYYSVLITNNSSKAVTYTYNGSPNTLLSGVSEDYQVKAYTQPPKDISVPGALSVEMENKGEEYVFVNVPPIDLHVINTLSVSVTIKADDYIDNDGSTELAIGALTEVKTAKIYTGRPNFSVSSGYSPNIVWEISEGIMYVTIK
jgi:hypothetical protein